MKLVGRYQVHSRIGQGAMANVYRAHDPEIQRDLAIKILNERFRRDAECVARFLRESRAAGSLSHPNITTIYDVGEAEGFPYLAMELLKGTPLDTALTQRGAFSTADVLHIGMQIADALGYAHARGVVHRDIKPSNILVCEDGRTVKLLDFGIARVAESVRPRDADEIVKTQVGQVLGTPRYMSPEQALGQPLDGRSDLFSLGAILYELVTGKPAFSGESMATLALQITTQDPPPIADLTECPRGLAFIIDKLLAKSAERRYPDGASVVAALKRELAALDTSADERSRRMPLHLRFALLASGAVAVVLSAGIGWVLIEQYRAMERVALTSGASVASFVASNVALPMVENASVTEANADWLPVQAFVNSASADDTIVELRVIDRQGVVRASSHAPDVGRLFTVPADQRALDRNLDVRVSPASIAGSSGFRFVKPIVYGSNEVGLVDFTMRKDALQAAADTTRVLLIGLGILMCLVAFGLSFAAGRVILNPVRRLNGALKEAATGKLDFRISHQRRDEFGELFDNFNALANDVQSRLDRTPKPANSNEPRNMAETVVIRPGAASGQHA